ncbi:hypothetical protein [Tissierella sp.]|uniref:hypothetical protein n=1 Tax=Tissierella sp. TaxID=41274 RepID=UPI0028AE0F9E|nr:hypothetical protein [Tissierella sp.]
MSNEELFEGLRDVFEVVIENIDENNKKQLHRLEDKIDKTNKNLDKLIDLLEKLL